MMRAALQFLVAFVTLSPSLGWSITVTITASKDNSIFGNNVNNSNGGGAGVFVGTTSNVQNNSWRRGLLKFDVAGSVPAGATIADVTLTMYLGQTSAASGTRTIDLHQLSVDWGEGTAGSSTPSISGTGTGFPAAVGDATWNQRFYQQTNWSNPGGDYVSTISASTDVGTALDTHYIWLSTPTLVSDVQGWLDQSSSNNGWIMIDHVENVQQTVKGFYSRNAVEKNASGDPLPLEWRPTLRVTYVNGDYNGNGAVDAADYVVWRKTLDLPADPVGNGADGNLSSVIDAGDYTYWRARYGNLVGGLGISTGIPEPATITVLLLAGPLAFLRRWR